MRTYQGKRAIALVSGGLDSVVSLARARADMEVRLILFANYGQRALDRERNAVVGAANFYELPFREVELPWLSELSPSGMRRVEPGEEDAGGEPRLDVLESVWIPNRNGVLLGVAASFAESYGCGYVITGFNLEEAAEFPDNSEEYVTRFNAGLELSTRNAVKVASFTQNLTKQEILKLGVELSAPLSIIWSCYHARELMCGRCASCKRLKGAIEAVPPELRPPVHFDN